MQILPEDESGTVNTWTVVSKDVAKQTTTVIVETGDTLRAIAQQCLGDASRYIEIVALNVQVLEAALSVPGREHLREIGELGDWIFPGMQIQVPRLTTS